MQELFNDIIKTIKTLNLPFSTSNNLVVINTELLDASSSVNKKNIQFECLIYIYEEKNKILFFQKVEEKSSGLFLEKKFESYSQTGLSLNRKVISVQYGIEGKEYSYSFNLGELQKSIKEISKNYKWKFRIILTKKKIESYI